MPGPLQWSVAPWSRRKQVSCVFVVAARVLCRGRGRHACQLAWRDSLAVICEISAARCRCGQRIRAQSMSSATPTGSHRHACRANSGGPTGQLCDDKANSVLFTATICVFKMALLIVSSYTFCPYLPSMSHYRRRCWLRDLSCVPRGSRRRYRSVRPLITQLVFPHSHV